MVLDAKPINYLMLVIEALVLLVILAEAVIHCRALVEDQTP
jgi:hypothetical protein